MQIKMTDMANTIKGSLTAMDIVTHLINFVYCCVFTGYLLTTQQYWVLPTVGLFLLCVVNNYLADLRNATHRARLDFFYALTEQVDKMAAAIDGGIHHEETTERS